MFSRIAEEGRCALTSLRKKASGLPSPSATAARSGRKKEAVDKMRSEQWEAALASMDEILANMVVRSSRGWVQRQQRTGVGLGVYGTEIIRNGMAEYGVLNDNGLVKAPGKEIDIFDLGEGVNTAGCEALFLLEEVPFVA